VKCLLDTNVIVEIRKGSRANANVRSWFAALDPEAILLSVVTVGEIRRGMPDPLPVIDGLLAATAKVHGLTLATRNVKDVARSGAEVVNPFEA